LSQPTATSDSRHDRTFIPRRYCIRMQSGSDHALGHDSAASYARSAI
jgi:hypothetical protein